MDISFDEILKSTGTREEKLKRVAEKMRFAKGYSWVGIYDVGEKEIRIISWAGRSEPAFPFFPSDKGLTGRAIKQKQTIMVNDTEKDEDYLLTFTNTKSEVVSPIFDEKNEKIVGTIDVESETRNAFTLDDAMFLEECGNRIRTLWK